MPVTDPAVEEALVSERLAGIKAVLERHEELDTKLLAGVERLVELEERRDARETTALEAEQKRLEASAEAETERVKVEAEKVKAEIAERQASRAWGREQVSRFVAPAVLLVTGIATAAAAWVNGWFGGGSHR